jgi:hypothetical protein
MKTSLFILAIAFGSTMAAFSDSQFADQTDATRLTCVGCSPSSNSFGYNTYAGKRGLVTTAQIDQAKENAAREYATSSQAPKDAALAANNAALAKQRDQDRVIGKIEIKTVTPKSESK